MNKIVGKKTGITEEQIRNIVKTELRSLVEKVKKAEGGIVNDVFFVSTSEGEVVLRISPNRWCRFEAERWCFKECQKIGVPVPKVLTIGKIELPNFSYPLTYSILERIPGRPLKLPYLPWLIRSNLVTRVLNALSPDFRKILKESGKLLAKIHSIKTKRFGWLTKPEIGMQSSWKEFILSLISEENFTVLLNAKLLGYKGREIIIKLFKNQMNLFDLNEGRLLHGDWSTENIIVMNGKIGGIIDFEDAISGDPFYDLAIPTLYADIVGHQHYTQELLSGYEIKPDETFRRKISLYQLAAAISRMAWAHKEGLNENARLLRKWIRMKLSTPGMSAF